MFEFLSTVMLEGESNPEYPNVRFPVSIDDIRNAELRMGMRLPMQLREFFSEIGCGFLKASQAEISRTCFNYINRFLDPDEIAGLFLGEDEDAFPSEGFGDGEIPFFEIGDRLYLVMKNGADSSYKVCWPFGDVICEDLVSFLSNLIINPRFYHDTTS